MKPYNIIEWNKRLTYLGELNYRVGFKIRVLDRERIALRGARNSNADRRQGDGGSVFLCDGGRGVWVVLTWSNTPTARFNRRNGTTGQPPDKAPQSTAKNSSPAQQSPQHSTTARSSAIRAVDRVLEETDAHFVGGLFASHYPLGRGVWVVGIARGIIVHRFHAQDRAFGKFHGFSVTILILPAEIPVGHVDQRNNRAIGLGGDDLHLLAHQMHVRRDAQ